MMAVMPGTAKLSYCLWSGQSKKFFSLFIFHIFAKMITLNFCNKKWKVIVFKTDVWGLIAWLSWQGAGPRVRRQPCGKGKGRLKGWSPIQSGQSLTPLDLPGNNVQELLRDGWNSTPGHLASPKMNWEDEFRSEQAQDGKGKRRRKKKSTREKKKH